jgi:hypothetical protein
MVPLRTTSPHTKRTSRTQRGVQTSLPRPTRRGFSQRRSELVRRRCLGCMFPLPSQPLNPKPSFSMLTKGKCYWSLQNGNETSTWFDARLTQVGRAQAQTAHDAWRKQIESKIPFPEVFYVSPLNRCLETAYITFNGLEKEIVRPFRPMVKEVCSVHPHVLFVAGNLKWNSWSEKLSVYTHVTAAPAKPPSKMSI